MCFTTEERCDEWEKDQLEIFLLEKKGIPASGYFSMKSDFEREIFCV